VGSAAAAAGATGAGVALAGLGAYAGTVLGARYGAGKAPRVSSKELRETKNYATFGALLMPWFGIGPAVGAYIGAAPNPNPPDMFKPTKAAAKKARDLVGGHVYYVQTHAPDSWRRDPDWEPRSERTLRYTPPGATHETIVAGFKTKKAAMDWAKKNGLTVTPWASNPGDARSAILSTEWPPQLVKAWGDTGITAGQMADGVIDTAKAAGWSEADIAKDPRGAMLAANEIWLPGGQLEETGWGEFPEYVENPGKAQSIEIELVMATGERERVPATQVTPYLVVHRCLRRGKACYGITHAPTGQLVAAVWDEKWATRLAKEIHKFSGPGLASTDVAVVQQAVGGPGMRRTLYLAHVGRQSQEKKPGKFPTFKQWEKTSHELDENPWNPESLKADAAVAAAVGSIVGAIAGAALGAVVLGGVGAIAGAAAFGAEAGVGGGVVGAIYGIPLGGAIGTIWGAVRQTGKVVAGHPEAGSAKLGAGLGSAFFGPIGAGLGAYVGSPG
jgi:hypothetical protein